MGNDDTLTMTNWLVTAIFLIGMCIEFFLPFRLPHAQGGSMVKNHARIARRYVCGWFLLDLPATIPWDSFSATTGRASNAAKMLRLARLLKVCKPRTLDGMRSCECLRFQCLCVMCVAQLGRIIRASRIITRIADNLENHFTISCTQND